MHKWNIFKVTPKKSKENLIEIEYHGRQGERGAERGPLLMLRWFFYIFSLLHILCNLYVCTRRIRNGCACVCNYFLYTFAYFIKNYMNMQMQMLPELHLQFVYCFFYRFWHFLFCSNSFLLFFIPFLRSTCKFRAHSAKNNVHCFMWPTVVYVYTECELSNI